MNLINLIFEKLPKLVQLNFSKNLISFLSNSFYNVHVFSGMYSTHVQSGFLGGGGGRGKASQGTILG